MEYHHIGIPTQRHDPEEGYDPRYKYFSWGYEKSEFHIQWHRFEAGAPFHEKITTVPHIAFKVKSHAPYTERYPVIMGPLVPAPNFKVIMIDLGETIVELIETDLDEESVVKEHKKNIGKEVSGRPPKRLTYQYHYFAIPTSKKDNNFKLTSLSPDTNPFGTQTFDPHPDLPKLVQEEPHAAFVVPDLKEALENRTTILPPQEPSPGYRIAFIEEVGAPIALIQKET